MLKGPYHRHVMAATPMVAALPYGVTAAGVNAASAANPGQGRQLIALCAGPSPPPVRAGGSSHGAASLRRRVVQVTPGGSPLSSFPAQAGPATTWVSRPASARPASAPRGGQATAGRRAVAEPARGPHLLPRWRDGASSIATVTGCPAGTSSATTWAAGYPDCCATAGSARWASGLSALPHRGTRDNHTLLVTFARLHGAELVADGLIAAVKLASLVAELKPHLADPATITLHRLPCRGLARKPAHGQTPGCHRADPALESAEPAPCGMSGRG